MGQFKPMVKMETTEPSVILKLKKGGHVAMKSKGENGHAPMKKMDGGTMGALAQTPALVGRPALNAPVRAPGKPSMAARRRAMMAAQRPRMAMAAAPANPAVAGMPMMKKGGKAKAKGGEVETPAMHKMEMKGIKGIGKELKSHEGKPASKAHAGLKKGGMATGGVPMGAGGYKTGGVAKRNAGGYKKGGAAKKFADGGPTSLGSVVGASAFTPAKGTVPRGGPTPGGTGGGGGGAYGGLDRVYGGASDIGDALSDISKSSDDTKAALGGSGLSGGGGGKPIIDPSPFMKKGGKVSKKFANGGRVDSGRAVSMPQGHKKPSQPISTIRFAGTFKKGGKVKRLNSGSDAQSVKETKGYEDFYTNEEAENRAVREAMSKAINPMTYFKPLAGKVKRLFSPTDAPGAITKTEKSTTIVPKKRSGGTANC